MLSSPAAHFALLAFSSLFSVINPISAAPIFVALTADAPEARPRIAWRACVVATAVLVFFALAGGAIFAFFGITVPAFQIAGGILFTIMSLRAMQNGVKEIPSGDDSRSDPAAVPLGTPIIAGPGAITTVMALVGQAQDAMSRVALGAAILVSMLLTLLILLAAPAIVARIGKNGQRIVTRIMGLITTVIGIQFVINGVTTILVEIIRAARS